MHLLCVPLYSFTTLYLLIPYLFLYYAYMLIYYLSFIYLYSGLGIKGFRLGKLTTFSVHTVYDSK